MIGSHQASVSAHRLPRRTHPSCSAFLHKEVHGHRLQIRLVSEDVVCLFFRDPSRYHLICICVHIICLRDTWLELISTIVKGRNHVLSWECSLQRMSVHGWLGRNLIQTESTRDFVITRPSFSVFSASQFEGRVGVFNYESLVDHLQTCHGTTHSDTMTRSLMQVWSSNLVSSSSPQDIERSTTSFPPSIKDCVVKDYAVLPRSRISIWYFSMNGTTREKAWMPEQTVKTDKWCHKAPSSGSTVKAWWKWSRYVV